MKKLIFYSQRKGLLMEPEFTNFRQIPRARKNKKILKVYVNNKFRWFVKFGKLDRNLHIFNNLWDLEFYTDY